MITKPKYGITVSDNSFWLGLNYDKIINRKLKNPQPIGQLMTKII